MESEYMTDKELIELCLEGDSGSFALIMERYGGKAMALAVNVLRSREDAQDACQDAFIKAYLNLPKFDFRKDFKNWFYTLLYNRCIDTIRKRRRGYLFFEKAKKEMPQYVHEEPAGPSGIDRLDGIAMKDLTAKERLALFLWAHDGYTGEEIAVILKCSSSTARVHLFKARKKIKTFLEKNNVAMSSD